MDRRCWPRKKKSSDKSAAEKAAASLETAGTHGDQESYKKPTYVQISVESYSHLTGLEDQVKTCEEQIKILECQIEELNENLSAAHSEVTTKDNLVKQHSKVAEEAVSGWEKAEAEALALKNHLETVTLSNLSAEDRAAHLDDALKECMRQIRNLKEENEHKLRDVIFTKTMQWDKIRLEFEAKISNLDQELMRSDAENAAISRSLQERSNLLIKISEDKSQAEAEIELLKGNIESLEREINSQKYELQIVAKELEIRNEEKNMSMRSAEVANKQHMEGVKKIVKLEAEVQRLRGLVRKKLPGPAAVAQMKLEVENLGRDYGDVRIRPPVGTATSHTFSGPEFTLHDILKFQKENEFLTERFTALEEETKMLKEALAKRNSELQTSRSLCAKAASRLQIVESQHQNGRVQRSSANSVVHFTTEGFSSQSYQPSLTSMSEDANDDESSVASWATGLRTENSQLKGTKSDKSSKNENTNDLELMDDFLEMEKLACLSNESNRGISILDNLSNKVPEILTPERVSTSKNIQPDQQYESTPVNVSSFEMELLAAESKEQPLMKLRSRICMIFESIATDSDKHKVLEDIKHVVQDAHDALDQHSIGSCSSEDLQDSVATCDRQANPDDAGLIAEKEIALSQSAIPTTNKITQDLEAAISQIHDFVLFLGKESMKTHDTPVENHGLGRKIEEFSITFDKVVHSNTSLADFILDLSHVLSEASSPRFSLLGCEGNGETINLDCIDKVALPVNKLVQKDLSHEKYQNGFSPMVQDDGNLILDYESNGRSCKVLPEEYEELKSERHNLKVDLGRCSEDLEAAKSKLQETEQLLAEVKSKLASAQKSNSLAETQLKCMAESYRSLESRAEELDTQLNLLRAKTETLENELQDERCNHQEALAKYKELQIQIQRYEVSSVGVDGDLNDHQERDLVAASEKLAECQETIFLLSKQLKSLGPETTQRAEPTKSSHDIDPADTDPPGSAIDMFNSPCTPSDTEGSFMRSPLSSKHRQTKSSSSSSSFTTTPVKHARGFGRFFSSK